MKNNFLIWLLFYVTGLVMLLPETLWYVNNPDTFQYLNISRHYLSGNWTEAINGYWSPLLSWMLVPLLPLGDDILMLKLLQSLLGAASLYFWCSIVNRAGLTKFYSRLLMIGSLPFLWVYALLNPTADLLFFVLLLVLLNFLLAGPVWRSSKRVLQFGVLGAILYFAKSFGLVFFLLLMIVTIVYENRQVVEKVRWKNVLIAFVILSSFSGVWIGLISNKYQHFTISESVAFNLSKEVAPLSGQIMQLPVLTSGLLKPAGQNAISAWEEPMQAIPLTALHPFSGFNDFNYYLSIVKRNLLTIWYFDFKRQTGWFFMLFIITFILFSIRSGNRKIHWRSIMMEQKFFYPLVVLCLVYLLYSLILVHTRYIWICTWLMFFLSAIIATEIISKNLIQTGWGKYLLQTLMICMMLIAVKRPVKEIFFTRDTDLPVNRIYQAIRHPFQTLNVVYKPDRDLHRAAKEIQSFQILHGPVASVKNESEQRHAYSSCLYFAYYSEVPYYGQMESVIENELTTNDVKYLISWSKSDSIPGTLNPVYADDGMQLRIFQILK